MSDEEKSFLKEPWLGRVKVVTISALLTSVAAVTFQVAEKFDVVNTAMAQSTGTARDFNLHLTADVARQIEVNARFAQQDARFEEQRKDSKALYDAFMKRKKSKRLESIDAGEEED